MGITRKAQFVASVVVAVSSWGCDSVIGLDEFEIRSGLECTDPTGFDGRGCYSCPPVPNDPSTLLNACTTSPCTPFDNTTRVPNFASYATRPAPTPAADPPPVPPSGGDDDELPAQRCADLLPRPVYLYGSTALNLGLRTLANAIANPATLVVQNDTSCLGLDSILTGITRLRGVAQYWPVGSATSLPCAIETEQAADIGLCDVSPTTCVPGFTGNANLVDDLGPAQVFMFTVPNGSSQRSISKEAAYTVFGYDAGGVAPWTDPASLVRRGVSSGTQLTIAASLGLEPRFWRGVIKQRSSEVKPGLLALSDPEKALGITSADVAEEADTRANLRTLAYQQEGQECGFTPDSSLGSSDKRNVRDGHYELWAPFHFYTRGQNGRTQDPFIAEIVSYLTGARALPNGNTDFITTLKQAGLVPTCAMKVTRAREGARMEPYQPEPSCGCYFDASPPGAVIPPECKACQSAADCTSSDAPNCNFGFCEP